MTAVHTFSYTNRYDPPMPIVLAQLVAPESPKKSQEVEAVVDSCSDGTMVPVDLLDEIGALSVGTAIMSGVWGTRRTINLYLVHLQIGGHLISAVHVAGVPNEFGFVLGRNVLNQLSIHLNGPANVVEIPTEP